mmetsp:Transcript_107893/g.247323  ORF Transcript_107893/g.247323 Transcript_107893/m.247323 type:complete len:209 (+) Transcript_107893:2426-3052(+)
MPRWRPGHSVPRMLNERRACPTSRSFHDNSTGSTSQRPTAQLHCVLCVLKHLQSRRASTAETRDTLGADETATNVANTARLVRFADVLRFPCFVLLSRKSSVVRCASLRPLRAATRGEGLLNIGAVVDARFVRATAIILACPGITHRHMEHSGTFASFAILTACVIGARRPNRCRLISTVVRQHHDGSNCRKTHPHGGVRCTAAQLTQ